MCFRFSIVRRKRKKNIIGIEVCVYKSLKIQTSSSTCRYISANEEESLESVEKGTPVSSRLALFPFSFLFLFIFLSINKLQSYECVVIPGW